MSFFRSIPAWIVALALSVVVNMGGIATLASLSDVPASRGFAGESALLIELPPEPAPKPQDQPPSKPEPKPEPPPELSPPPPEKADAPKPPEPQDRETRLGQPDSMDPNSPAWLGSKDATEANQAPRHEVDQAAQTKSQGAPSANATPGSMEQPGSGDAPASPDAKPDLAPQPDPTPPAPVAPVPGEQDQQGREEKSGSMLDLGAEAKQFAERGFEIPPMPAPEAQPEQPVIQAPTPEGEGLKALIEMAKTARKALDAGPENRSGGAMSNKPSAAPRSATSPGGSSKPPGNPALEGENGELANRESDASSVNALTVDFTKTGKVVAGKGLRINTVKPRYSTGTKLLAFPDNPVVRITFGRDGKVLRVAFEKTTGEPDVDDPLRDAIHRWTAEGEELNTIPPNQNQVGLAVTFKIIFR